MMISQFTLNMSSPDMNGSTPPLGGQSMIQQLGSQPNTIMQQAGGGGTEGSVAAAGNPMMPGGHGAPVGGSGLVVGSLPGSYPRARSSASQWVLPDNQYMTQYMPGYMGQAGPQSIGPMGLNNPTGQGPRPNVVGDPALMEMIQNVAQSNQMLGLQQGQHSQQSWGPTGQQMIPNAMVPGARPMDQDPNMMPLNVGNGQSSMMSQGTSVSAMSAAPNMMSQGPAVSTEKWRLPVTGANMMSQGPAVSAMSVAPNIISQGPAVSAMSVAPNMMSQGPAISADEWRLPVSGANMMSQGPAVSAMSVAPNMPLVGLSPSNFYL